MITLCTTTYGDYPELIQRNLDSLVENQKANPCKIRVGLNACSPRVVELVTAYQPHLDRLEISEINLDKCGMMKRLFAGLETDCALWLDDDCWLSSAECLRFWNFHAQKEQESIWGCMLSYSLCENSFKKLQDWFMATAVYRGQPLNRSWPKLLSSWFMIRNSLIQELNWPIPELSRYGDGLILAEAARQVGKPVLNVGSGGILREGNKRVDSVNIPPFPLLD